MAVPEKPVLLLLPSDVSKRAGVIVATVIGWQNRGLIAPAFTTPSGVRLFDPETIRLFLALRKKRQRKRQRASKNDGTG